MATNRSIIPATSRGAMARPVDDHPVDHRAWLSRPGLTVERDLILSIVSDLLGEDEPVSADLPEQVEVTLHRNGDRTIVHLVNMSGARPNGFGKPLPVRNATLRIRGASPIPSARALVSDTTCAVTADGDGINVALPELAPGDRRSLLIVLTPSGEKTLKRAAPIHEDGIRRHFGASIRDDEVAAVEAALTRIAAAARQHDSLASHNRAWPGSSTRS